MSSKTEKTPLLTKPAVVPEDDETAASLRDRVTTSYTTIALVSALLVSALDRELRPKNANAYALYLSGRRLVPGLRHAAGRAIQLGRRERSGSGVSAGHARQKTPHQGPGYTRPSGCARFHL